MSPTCAHDSSLKRMHEWQHHMILPSLLDTLNTLRSPARNRNKVRGYYHVEQYDMNIPVCRYEVDASLEMTFLHYMPRL